jgi:mannan endo-1,4-beta-mannosidase
MKYNNDTKPARGVRPVLVILFFIGAAAILTLLTVLPNQPGANSSPTPTPTPVRPVWSTNPDEFVTREGSQLRLGGKPFRIVGANMPWLGLDEFNGRNEREISYPTQFRIDDGLKTAQTMGASVVRAHSLGISVGCPLCLMPAPGKFNDAAFETIDYSLATARKYNLRLIIPLTDQWHYYHGGKHFFTNARGHGDIPDATPANNAEQRKREAHFYTDRAVIEDFKGYIAYLLNHKNRYTGIALKDDPTILAWQIGNELWDAPDDWTREMAIYLKQLAPRTLVADGSAATGVRLSESRVAIPELDLVGGHFHPPDLGWMNRDAAVAEKSGKVYFVGEFDWQGWKGGAALEDFLAEVEKNPAVNGALFWALRPRCDCGGFINHESQYDLHYPGLTPALKTRVQLLQDHAFRLFANARK